MHPASLTALLALAWMTATTRQVPVNAETKALQLFAGRVAVYVALHQRLEREVPRIVTSEPARIEASRAALAAKIRRARAAAQQGNIFDAETRRVFRRLLSPELKGPTAVTTRSALEDDAPPRGAVTLRVNAAYPPSQPVPTMPPNLLSVLPPLPTELEYRIIARHLILLDTHATLIVDVITDAVR